MPIHLARTDWTIFDVLTFSGGVNTEYIKLKKLHCARCGKILHPYTYIKNLKHANILNKGHLLSFCDDCLEKKEIERR